MPEITLLSQETIDKIAAGEVIERPSSVVKELVENAIDAKATAITIEIKEGGISFVRITDNGCGIDKNQVPLAFLRHSTSKIKSVEDLMCVHSLGFRGEALSSIAAVAQVELITKPLDAMTGTRYVIEGSKEKELEEIGAPDGTTFLVRNLFYNTPARKKFLKSAPTEANYISDLVERLALSHPDISFKYIQNGQTKMHTSGNSKQKDLIYHIYGRDIAASLLPVSIETPYFKAEGFIGKPNVFRGNRTFENYFINGRYIKSSLIARAIEEAYKGYLMQHQYPFCVLHFTMEQEELDVNVHPTKMELRFGNQEAIYKALYEGIRNLLAHKDFIADVPVDEKEKKAESKPAIQHAPEPFEVRRINDIRKSIALDSPYERKYPTRPDPVYRNHKPIENQKSIENQKPIENQTDVEKVAETIAYRPLENVLETPAHKPSVAKSLSVSEFLAKKAEESQPPVEESTQETFEKPTKETLEQPVPETYEQQELASLSSQFLTKDARKKHKIIGQLFDTYWLIEYEDKLFIIDQHAAHEKVLYEKTMAKIKEKSFSSQILSPPIILTLQPQEVEMLQKYQDTISMFGYSVEHFGGKEYAVNGIPADFSDIDVKTMFLEMLDDFTTLNGKDGPSVILEKVASMSCKAAVKGNNHLSRPEIETLIDELLQLENPYHCPHGRPTIISMTKYEIEKKFKRIV